MSKTTVVNVRSPQWTLAKAMGTNVYVGRPCRGFKGSPFANPFKVGPGIPRGEAIKLYCQWAAGTLAHPKGKKFPHDQIESLRGKVLGCWCHPAPCHAGILAEMLNRSEAKGRCINCFHDFKTGPCGGCGSTGP